VVPRPFSEAALVVLRSYLDRGAQADPRGAVQVIGSGAHAVACAALAVCRRYLIVVPRQIPAAPRSNLIVMNTPLPAAPIAVCRKYLIVLPRPLPAAQRSYLNLLPMPMPAALRIKMIVLPRP
jgi:hypothetical protein